jgi:hypothetical protein
VIALLSTLLVLAATPDDCREAYAAVNYKDAARICVEVLSDAPTGELPGLYRLAGLSLAAVGDDDRATVLFESLLAMEPNIRLDESISPKLRAPFDQAQRERKGAGLTLEPSVAKAIAGKPLELSVAVKDGPGHPVTELALRRGGQQRSVARADPTRFSLEPAPAGKLALQLTAVDRFGGRLLNLPFALDVAAAPVPRGGLLSWKVWAVAAAVVLAGATVSAIVSRQAFTDAGQERYASDAASKLALSNGTAVGADVGFGAGGLLGLGAVVLFLTEPRE